MAKATQNQRRSASAIRWLALAAAIPAAPAAHAQAYTEQVLYSFCAQPNCADGSVPYAGVIRDSAGNLYGATSQGGVSARPCSVFGNTGCGVVFKLDAAGNYSVLHSFTGRDGSNPIGGLVQDPAGNLYGTTSTGGLSANRPPCGAQDLMILPGCGVLFKIDATGNYSVLHRFCSHHSKNLNLCVDGQNPNSSLVRDAKGNLYGTALGGSNSKQKGYPIGAGVVFKLDTAGHYKVLYNFCSQPSCADGIAPQGIIRDSKGDIYGTAALGGAVGGGVVFKLAASGGYDVLYNFCSQPNCDDGSYSAGVIRDAKGSLYGTTYQGGGSTDGFAEGVVFELDAAGNYSVLYSFNPSGEPNVPGGPGGLARDSAGNLYGATISDDALVFKLDTAGNYSVLYDFGGPGPNGAQGGVILDSSGNLYGTTAGDQTGGFEEGYGTVFMLKP